MLAPSADLPFGAVPFWQSLRMDVTEQASSVSLTFSRAPASVLFEWLHRVEDAHEDLTRAWFEDQAEQRVLWNMSACLETALTEPLRPNYDALLDAARGKVRDPRE